MSPDPNARFQEHLEFTESHWYPGLISLEVGKTLNNVTTVDFTRQDLFALRGMIDGLLNCTACADDRHEDCPQHHGGVTCGCDQRTLHQQIFSAQVQLYRASRKY